MKSILGLLVLLLTGCGQAAAPAPTDVSINTSDLQIAVATDDFAQGKPRLPFLLYDGSKRVAEAERVRITAFDLSSSTPTPEWKGEATRFSDYEVPYWVAYPELSHAGRWGLVAEVVLADGAAGQAQFAIEVAAESQAPSIGSRPPSTQNRTLATEPDLKKLTSDWEPEPALYLMTVSEAMQSGKPTVVTFATPAFCRTEICAPVVESVKEAYRLYGADANFIHIEVFQEFNPELVLAEEMVEWGFHSEPWTYVLDSQGKVARRFGGPLSPRELKEAVAQLLP